MRHLTAAWSRTAARPGGPAVLSALVDVFAQKVPGYDDPALTDGECIRVEAMFRRFTESSGLPYRSVYVVGPKRMSAKRIEYLSYYGDRPERMTHNASSLKIDGEWWTVDFTYSQFDETAPWPLVERESAFLARFTTSQYFNES